MLITHLDPQVDLVAVFLEQFSQSPTVLDLASIQCLAALPYLTMHATSLKS